MDPSVITVVLGALAPFCVLAWVLVRGSRGGKVCSLVARKDSGRQLDTHAVHGRTEAARDAQKHLERRRNGGDGWLDGVLPGRRGD